MYSETVLKSLKGKEKQRATFLSENHPFLMAVLSSHKTHKNKNITFENYRYMKSIYLDKSDYMVVQKATQCGVSEYLIAKSIMKADHGRSVFYILPTWELKNRFVKNRFDLTMNYIDRITDDKVHGGSESASLKHIGKGAIAFIGSNSASAFTEYPADDVEIDEFDRCNQENLEMAIERQSASKDPNTDKVSNPTISDYGINAEYKNTDMKEWILVCSSCNKHIKPDFFTHVVKEVEENEFVILDKDWDRYSLKDIKTICDKCKKPFDRFVDGEWVKKNKRSNKSGYHISKMFSTNMKISGLLDRFEGGQKSDIKMQRFYNGDLGVPYTASGSKVSYDMLDACIDSKYAMPSGISDGACVMGIDVGTQLHIRINNILSNKKLRAVYINTLDYSENSDDVKEIAGLWKRYRCLVGVVDGLPEQRLARKLCSRFKGMFRWFNGRGKKDHPDLEHKIITTDRNLLLDDVKESIMTQNLILPRNVKMLLPITSKGVSEYYDNMTASTRTFDEQRKEYVWKESRPDHYMFAEGYTLLAKKLLLTLSRRK